MEDEIKHLRLWLSTNHDELKSLIERTSPPVVQELTLALRHLEDARMRLGVAITLDNGQDPWES